MVKQLEVSTYLLTLSCADLRWKELSYIKSKLNNLGLSEKESKNLATKNDVIYCKTIQFLLLVIFIIKLKCFSKRSYLMGH